MKTIITGATGFVGQNLREYLGEEHVVGVSRESNSTMITYDQVAGALDSANAFIHLAGKAHDLKKTSNDAEYFEVNRDLTISLFKSFLKSKCPVFVYMSSVKAVADTVEGQELSEDDTPNPLTPYGRSKREAEEYLLNQSLPEGKFLYILRPCMIHGPGNKGNLNLLYKFTKKGLPYPLAAFENKRSFLTVENLCFVIKCLTEEKPKSGVFQVADDESLSTNQLMETIAKAMNKKVKLWSINASLIKAIARFGDFLRLPLNSERLQKLTENYVVSNVKIKNTLGRSLPISSRDGLITTINSFKNA